MLPSRGWQVGREGRGEIMKTNRIGYQVDRLCRQYRGFVASWLCDCVRTSVCGEELS